jgi:hypothetical protein
MRFQRIALGLLIFGLAVTAAAAQTGGLRVVVTDDKGPLPGATVILSNDRGYVKATPMITGADGTALFPVLRAGAGYAIEVSAPTYGKQRVPDIQVKLSQEITIPVQLSMELVERVIVEGTTDVVDLTEIEQTTRFSDQFIQDLPVPGRFYQNVLTMAPGVQDDDGDGNPTVHGSRARDFKAVVSGISNVDPLTGQRMSEVNPNSIEEMEVITAGAGVEFGRAQGGYARIIQKQGSNEFEGLVEAIYRSDKLDGNGATNLTGERLPKFSWYQPSVQFSGPIVKDKLWYRLSHEYIYREDPVDVGNDIALRTWDQGINSDQLTWQMSPRNKLAFLFESDPFSIENLDVSSLTPSESSRKLEIGGEKYQLTWTAPYSPKLLVETIVAYQDHQVDILPMVEGAPNNCITDPRRPSLISARCFDVVLGTVSGSYMRTHRDHRQRLSVINQATIYGGRFWGMNHEFKLGFGIENERYFRDLTQNPSLTRFYRLNIDDSEVGGEIDLTREEIFLGRFTVPLQSTAQATGTIWGFYAQDQVKPLQNLTVTVGFRIDREAINSIGTSQFDTEAELLEFMTLTEGLTIGEKQRIFQGIFTGYEDIEGLREGIADQLGADIDATGVPCPFCPQNSRQTNKRKLDDINLRNTTISPSLSMAWDPWSNGKTKFSFGMGRHYNNTPLVIPLIELEPATVDLELNCVDGACRPAGHTSIKPNVQVVDRDLQTPYQDEFFLSFERELWAESSIKLTYLNRKYRDQFQDIDLNHAPGDYGRCVLQNSPDQNAVVPITDPDDPLYGQYPFGGDGELDDCIGLLYFPETDELGGGGGGGTDPGWDIGSGLAEVLNRPDGVPDLYVQNMIFGDIWLVGNFNEADYEAYILEFVRRQYRGWEMQGSYRWSKATGNGEDFAQALGDDRTLLDDEQGYQSNDRRHEVKIAATTITPWGFRLGTSVSWLSGLPYSLLERRISRDAIAPFTEGTGASIARPRTVYLTGTRNDQRNKSYWRVNVKFTKEMNLPHGMNLQMALEVFNLLNDGTYFIYNRGLETGQQINGVNDSYNEFGRRFQIGAKLSF